jgi:molybdate transport system regulatory protein
MSVRPAPPLLGKLAFETSAGGHLNEPRIRLLEAIASHGSLSRAAKDVPLSYKAAWDALDAMNTLAEVPLVVRTTGGRHGGGTQLTEHGRQIVGLYRAMESSQQDILNQLAEMPAQSAAAHEKASMRSLIRRLSVKTSARNQFLGCVAGWKARAGLVDVELSLQDGERMVATITPESVHSMGLGLETEVYALVKAPWISVVARRPPAHSQRNCLAGSLQGLRQSGANMQLEVVTQSGVRIVAAMPSALVLQRGLVRGMAVWAGFATDSVILASFS